MKKLIITLACLPFLASAGESIDKTIDIPLNGSVYIETPRGEVEIKSWNKAQFKVTGTLDDMAEGYKLDNNGKETRFIVDMPKKRFSNWNKGEGSNLTIYMPINNRLSFEGINVDVSASNLQAGSKLKTVNGNVIATDLSGKVSLETVNGNVDAKNLDGNISFSTVNGDIDDYNSNGKLRFNAVNGDIKSRTQATNVRLENVNGEADFEIESLSDLRLNTVNGEIKIVLNELKSNGNIQIDTVSGDLDLYLPSDVSARFDIATHAGGHIRNQLSDDKVIKAKYGPSKELEFSLNSAKADVEIDTVSGRINLKKKSPK